MAHTDKAGERTTLIFQLGRLLAPIYDLAEKQTPPTSTEYQVAAARFNPDLNRWTKEAHDFVNVGGFIFDHALDDIIRSPNIILRLLATLAKQAATNQTAAQFSLNENLKIYGQETTAAAINRVPILPGISATLGKS
jgi:hypothetical protein